jgi:hypothetical protein
MKKELILIKETRTAQDDKGQTFQYDVYYVEVHGLKLELKPKDTTSKQILKNHYETSGN